MKDVFQSQFAKAQKFFSEHVWYNPKISVCGNSVFLKNFFNSGIVFIYDLLGAKTCSTGNIYSFDCFKRDLKAKLNFVEYAGLKKVI